MRKQFIAAVLAAAVVAPVGAQAQIVNGTVNGAQRGADQGENVGGPVGSAVGGVLGAGVGAVTGAVGTAGNIVGDVLGAGERPKFRDYAMRQHPNGFHVNEQVRVGAVLPAGGVEYYDVPPEYAAKPGYRYTVVNDIPVIVDPKSRKVVEVLN